MGGGDLNSKKSWHPSTLKNQERVWKAEQAAAQEKKRIVELQKERSEEHDRAELNALAHRTMTAGLQESDSTRLNWMYDKPDKKVQSEDYLLGKSVDGNLDGPSQVDKDVIPAVSRRVAGVSMVGAAADVQVDLVRKMREDPLLLVRERERAARAALLNNPLQRKKLAELLRRDQVKRQEKKSNKSKSKDKDIDNLLADKLNALGGQHRVDLATLLASDDSSVDSSDSSSSEEKPKKKKKKKKKEEKEKEKEKAKKSKKKLKKSKKIKVKYEEGLDTLHRDKEKKKIKTGKKMDVPKDKTPDYHYESKKPKYQDMSGENSYHARRRSRSEDGTPRSQYRKPVDHKISHTRGSSELVRYKNKTRPEEENRRDRSPHSRKRSRSLERRERSRDTDRAARLAEMARAGAEHEARRGARVRAQREREDAAPRPTQRPPHAPAQPLPDSLEARIHSNRHYIQRDKRHMNEHFARR